MADNHNYAALDWVIGEIGETLKQARQSLEAYVENPQDSTRIRFCLTHIHQVHGSLQMVEFSGAALLAAEMEALAQALMNGQVSNVGEAHEVLMRAILQLPIYLDQVKANHNDDPTTLLPLLNDLRAVRGSQLLSGGQFFTPDLTAAHASDAKKNPAIANPVQFQAIMQKLRKMYQYAAAGVIRGVNVDENLQYLDKVFVRLHKLTENTTRAPLWEIALGLCEALLAEQVQISASVKTLLREIDKEILYLSEESVKAFNTYTDDELLKNLLYYVARSQSDSDRIQRLRLEYGLEKSQQGAQQAQAADQLSAPDPDTLRTVVHALNDELEAIKHSLDMTINGRDGGAVAEAIPIMRRVGDTLSVLGLSDMREQMLAQANDLEQASEPTSEQLMAVAGGIIAMEQRLLAMAEGANVEDMATGAIEFNQAQESVLREARNGLEQAKDAIIEYIASQWERSHLRNVPALLAEIRGGLVMVPLSRPAGIVHSCAQFIEEQLLNNDELPDWSQLDTLADAIASVEYYLERLSGERDDDDELLLSVAEDSVAQLGYAVVGEPVSKAISHDHNQADVSSVLEKIADVESVESVELVDVPVVESAPKNDAPVANSEDDAEPVVEVLTEAEVVEEADALDESATEDIPTLVVEDISDEDETTDQQPIDVVAEDDEEIDDEILEIFVEEAGEVLEAVDEFFPLWSKDFEDTESLSEFRRAFHTLKGSGRMVGADDIGELAWSIENMLNRVMDKTIQPHQAQVVLIGCVREVLPEFISAFEHKQPNPNPTLANQYMEWATTLSQGELPQELLVRQPGAIESIDQEEAERTQTANPVETLLVDDAALDNGDLDDDGVLWGIFGSEALSHLAVVEAFIEEMETVAPIYTSPSEGMQRALHTLKGSAHMADVHDVAELATPLERFVKELRTYQVSIDDDVLQLLRDGVGYTREALAQIESGEDVTIAKLPQYLARVAELKERSVGPLIRQLEQEQAKGKKVDPELLSIFMAEEMNLLLDADVLLKKWQSELQDEAFDEHLQPLITELNTLATGADHANLPSMAVLSQQLAAVYEALAPQPDPVSRLDDSAYATLLLAHEQLLDMVDAVAAGQNLQDVDAGTQTLLEDLKAKVAEPLHVEMAELDSADEMGDGYPDQSVDEIAESIETEILETLNETELQSFETPPQDGDEENSIADANVELEGGEHIELTAAGTDTIRSQLGDDYDQDILELFIEEAEELSEEIERVVHDWQSEPTRTDCIDELKRHLHTLKGGARLSNIVILGDLAHDFETYLIDLGDKPKADASVFTVVNQYQDKIHKAVDAFRNMMSGGDGDLSTIGPTQVPVATVEVENQPDTNIVEAAVTATDAAASASAVQSLREQLGDDFDADIVEIFVDEADELSEEIEKSVHHWEEDWNNTESLDELKRHLHTLKGGARLAGLKLLGDLGHDFETYLIDLGESPQLDDSVFRNIHDYQDQILKAVETVKDLMAGGEGDLTGVNPSIAPTNDAVNTVGNAIADPAETDSTENLGADILPFTPKKDPVEDMMAVSADAGVPQVAPQTPVGPTGGAAPSPLQAKRQAPQEVVKVSAELLEELVNLAGETSIGRGRMEEQVSDMGFTLEEMESTIHRLQDQLRRLDIETEAQVLFRQEQMQEQEDFDPLEMDRYTQLQQLSRSLLESASDIMDLKATLSDKTRDAETLLLQQSRINTELQEGLMRSRMVPFSRLVPRLRRIVRQVSTELGKQVNFELDNVEGELDRTVLERMVAPLEHMLRNAVDHGIEEPETRIKAGKPETGRIVLSLAREGGDVMLRLADDGHGINLARVRDKAIERGLMSADANLSDRDIMQFILHAGFSTAENVTQISGRGVGMDVVNSEIKQLGGAMSINSREGEGTEFTVRLPFTVSVNRALMIRIGDDRYAVPLNTIEGIVRVSPFELEHYYQDPQARFEYAGEHYQVRYLGNLLHANTHPKLEGQVMPLPVVLVRTAQHAVAMQVDILMGSREIVVKSLGPQFGQVQGVSGATVMGDGSVVVILDPHAMIRRDAALAHMPENLIDIEPSETVINSDEKTVLVVDDSVTVRKVTSRLLEREGYNVITAKDGADALLTLQDHKPDCMLLDIEMPRMDGFEVAKNVRSSSHLADVPIIMITSRTGDKHRERALELGVNHYMGKPFQEDQLVHNIRVATKEIDADFDAVE